MLADLLDRHRPRGPRQVCPTCSGWRSTACCSVSDGTGPPTDERVVASAFLTLVDRLSADAPLVVAVDDVQWLDPSSQAVVAFGARRLKGRIGILVTERTETRYGLRRRVAPAEQARRRRTHSRQPAQPRRAAQGDRPVTSVARSPGPRSSGSASCRAATPSMPSSWRGRWTARIRAQTPTLPGVVVRTGALPTRPARRGHPDRSARGRERRRPTVDLLAEVTDREHRPRRRTPRGTREQRHRADRRQPGPIHPSTAGPRGLQRGRTRPPQTDAPHPGRHRRAARTPRPPPRAGRLECRPVDAAMRSTQRPRLARARGAPAAAAELVRPGHQPRWRQAATPNPVRPNITSARATPHAPTSLIKPTVDQLPSRTSSRECPESACGHADQRRRLRRGRSSCSNRALVDAEGDHALIVRSLLLSSYAQFNSGRFGRGGAAGAARRVERANDLAIPELTSQVLDHVGHGELHEAATASTNCVLQRALELEDREADIPFSSAPARSTR